MPVVIMWVELRKSNIVVLGALVAVVALWWLFSRRRQALAVGAVALLVGRRVKWEGHFAFGPPMMVGALIGLLTAPGILANLF